MSPFSRARDKETRPRRKEEITSLMIGESILQKGRKKYYLTLGTGAFSILFDVLLATLR